MDKDYKNLISKLLEEIENEDSLLAIYTTVLYCHLSGNTAGKGGAV